MADCLRFRCDVPSFGIQEELDFILKGNLSFGWISQVCRPSSRVPPLTLRWCLVGLGPSILKLGHISALSLPQS